MAMNFPDAPVLNQQFTSPDGDIYTWDGVKWTIPSGGGGGLSAITQNMSVYVSPSGNDIPTNGLTPSTPFATISYAFSVLQTQFRYALPGGIGAVVTIQLAPGTYTSQGVFQGHIPGQQGHFSLVVNGDVNNPQNYTLAGGISADHGAMVSVQGVTLTNANGNCIYCNNAGFLAYHSVVFGNAAQGTSTAPGAHIEAQAGGIARSDGNYTIAGSASSHWLAQGSGSCIWIVNGAIGSPSPTGPVITISGNPAFGQFAWLGNLGSLNLAHASFVNPGNATGLQYDVHTNAVIATGTSGAMVFPGNQPGVTSLGGLFT